MVFWGGARGGNLGGLCGAYIGLRVILGWVGSNLHQAAILLAQPNLISGQQASGQAQTYVYPKQMLKFFYPFIP